MRGMCVSSCPDYELPVLNKTHLMMTFEPNYTDYTCVESRVSVAANLTGNITVKKVELGYRYRIPKDQIVFLKVAVSSYANITEIYWKQLDPIPDLSDACDTDACPIEGYWESSIAKNKFIFDDITLMSLSD